MAKFTVGDKVVCTEAVSGYLIAGQEYTVTMVYFNGDIAVNTVHGNYGWLPSRFKLVGQVEEQPQNTATAVKKTGGSTPNQYRLSVNLPLTSDRTQFVDVDLEATDVIDALDLSGNLKDVQKALFRMGKKQDTPVTYDLNKCLFYILREMKKRDIIGHAKFWEVSEMLDKMLGKMLNEGEE